MTTTITVLSQRPVTAQLLVDALATLNPDLLIDDHTPGYLTVSTPNDQTAFHVETPTLVQAPGEAERLLNTASPPVPYWWTDIHVPPDATSERRRLALSVIEQLCSPCDVVHWSE